MSLSPRGGGRDGWRIGRRRQTWAMQGWLRLSGTSDGGRCITSDVSIPADAGLSLRHAHTRTLARTHASELIEASGFGPTPGTGGNDCHPFFSPHQPPALISAHTKPHVYTQIHIHMCYFLPCSLKCQVGEEGGGGGLCVGFLRRAIKADWS